ncbi:transglutaminase-like superfamily protein [Sarocladium implicatum]|nr:transglutaminase-like superfamily protein [Sarocladium implicatum]
MVVPFLPDEIITKILPHLDPDDVLRSISLTCRRFHSLATDPLLWRSTCLSYFRAFSFEHDFDSLLLGPAQDVDWLELFRLRQRRNARAVHLLDDMTKSPRLQLSKLEELCSFDYDVKEVLIQQSQSNPYQDDGLSRAYWARRALGSIHRRRAVGVWMELRNPARGPSGFCRPTPERAFKATERGHAAYDMFVLHDSWCDIDWISQQLDKMAAAFQAAIPDLDNKSTRDKALLLNIWMREAGLRGIRSDRQDNYRNLRNCLIGQALRHPDHETIPITSSAIFCALAQRVGFDAASHFGPGHVLVSVRAEKGRTLDGHDLLPGQSAKPMYLDPWGRDDEMPFELVSSPVGFNNWHTQLDHSSSHAVETVMRVHNNIVATCEAAENRFLYLNCRLGVLSAGHREINLMLARYACCWARLLLAEPDVIAFGGLEAHGDLCSILQSDFPEDVSWAAGYLTPMLQSNPERFLPHVAPALEEAIQSTRANNTEDPPDTRGLEGSPDYVPGRVFEHKRNGMLGIIIRAKMPSTLPSTGPPDFFECQ